MIFADPLDLVRFARTRCPYYRDLYRDLPVDAALKKEVEKLKYIAERNPSAPFMHEVSIIGDRKIPYEVLSSVLYTAGQNELENFRFVLVQKDPE